MRDLKNVVLLLAMSALMLGACKGNGDADMTVTCPQNIRYNDPVCLAFSNGATWAGTDVSRLKKSISVSPAFDFEVELSDDASTLNLYPAAPLEYRREYQLSINLSKVGIGKGKSKCTFTTLAPMASINWGSLTCDSAGDAWNYTLSMDIISSDPLDSEYLEKRTSVPSSVGSVAWDHSQDGLSHSAHFSGIKAGDVPLQLKFSCKLERYSISEEKTYIVPGREVFCAVSSKVVADPYHYEVTFSDVIAPRQDFQSLVTMPSAGRLTFVADANILKITPSQKPEGRQEIRILKSLKSASGHSMSEEYESWFAVPSKEPFLRFVSKGTVLPSAGGMNIHFESSNYRKVRVRCRRIYENNVLQFLQNNRLSDAECYLGNVARQILDTTILLGSDDALLTSPSNYGLNLAGMVNVQRGAIYKIELGGVEPLASFNDERYESDYWLGSWKDYADRTRNVLVSDLAVIAKQGEDGEYRIIVSDIISATAVSGARVDLYNDVNQCLASGRTDGEGMFTARIQNDRAITAIVSDGKDKAYLCVKPGESLSLSNFDVGGVTAKGGIKGFIFAERGVWRPGDEIHLSFIASAERGSLPQNHPVSVNLYDPMGQLMRTEVSNSGRDGLYSFCLKTDRNAPTGRWNAVVSMGGQSWTKAVRIETVKPNNILISLEPDSKILPSSAISGKLSAKWNVGIPADGLSTVMEATFSSAPTSFKNYPGYCFTDRSRSFEQQTVRLYEGRTDAGGNMRFNAKYDASSAPGMLKASFTTRVFEKNGDFSTSVSSASVSPYKRYIGMKLPVKTDEWGDEYLDRKLSHNISLVAVDRNGAEYSQNVGLTIELYKMGWNWWWSSSSDRLAQYARDSYMKPYKTITKTLTDGKGTVPVAFDKEESGFYFIRVCDDAGGHATSAVVMVRASYESQLNADASSATRLPISLDKDSYRAGEKARLLIPSADGAKALVSLEKGGSVLKTFWVNCTENNTAIEIPVSADMAPNIYASVSMIQPYNSSANDAPIRMFGVQRINVEEASTHLNPIADLPAKTAPEGKLSFNVRERDGRPMSFVVALVDEGLLNLTSFKTPDPWKHFFATEALGVRTWDLYNAVIGAYGAKMEQLFAIGGDGENADIAPDSVSDRFPPVSMFFGPYTVGAKGKVKIDAELPKYVGTLRAMIVATDGHNMGCAQNQVQVTKPVMTRLTLPRLVGTQDEISVPVTVMALEDRVGEVKVELVSSGALEVVGESKKSVTLPSAGDKTVYFKMRASSKAGSATVKAVCKASSDSSTDEVNIEVRQANPEIAVSQSLVIDAGAKASAKLDVAGFEKLSSVTAEASSIPALNLDSRLKYLCNYPHGCLEQTVSAAFPQLYLDCLMEMDREKKEKCAQNVASAIAAIPSFCIPGGGMTTWPGTSVRAGANVWASIYATHFMIEASSLGYSIPASLRRDALSYVKKVASSGKNTSAMDRSYACYVLALAGSADRGAMSRLREDASALSEDELILLAAAYALDGKKDAARDLCSMLGSASSKHDPYSSSYPSKERTMALRIMLSDVLGDKASAFAMVKELSQSLSDRQLFLSTQACSWALRAVADYVRTNSAQLSGVDVSLVGASKSYSLKSKTSLASAALDLSSASYDIANIGKSPAFVVLSARGTADRNSQIRREDGMSIKVEYLNADGIAIDPASIARGTDFTCRVFITNRTLSDIKDVALTQIFPCGWEIRRGEEDVDTSLQYQDFRDDRVCSYFDLPKESTRRITVRLVATYAGKYYHPAITAEAMYNGAVGVVVPGFETEVK